MGLAATQARFLAITSRKARCEFESMQIAQQKLSCTREMEQATEDYQSALKTTRIIWDPDGSGTTTFDLSYDLIMYSSEVNNYTPFMISRSDGRIALNSTMAQAAKMAGIPEDGINGYNETMFYNFIEAMVATGGMSETAAVPLRKTTIDPDTGEITHVLGYQPYAGLGGALLDKTQSANMNLGNMVNFIDLEADTVQYGVINLGDVDNDNKNDFAFPEYYELVMQIPTHNANSNVLSEHYYSYNNDYTQVEDYGTYPVKLSESLNFGSNSNYLSIDGTRVSNEKPKYSSTNYGQTNSVAYTLSDLLTKDVTFAFTCKSKSDDPTEFWKKVLGNSDTFLNSSTILDGKADLISLIGVERSTNSKGESVLIYMGEELEDDERLVLEALNEMVTGFSKVLDVGNSEAETQAFNYAVLETLALLTRSKNLGNENYVADTYTACIDGANDYNCWVYKNSSKLNNSNTRAISMSSLAESFLTLYASAQNGFQPYGNNNTPYYITDSALDSFYVTDDQSYLYTCRVSPDKQDAVDMYNAEYYSILFNSLCRNGWYENIYIDDADYLQNALKNGQLFVNTLNDDDGYYYQERFNDNTHLMEATDEDAVTQAEREYSKAKSRINYKEEQLELDMKNLDLEISALTTEYDTVKNMISQNVEKTFTMFQS